MWILRKKVKKRRKCIKIKIFEKNLKKYLHFRKMWCIINKYSRGTQKTKGT